LLDNRSSIIGPGGANAATDKSTKISKDHTDNSHGNSDDFNTWDATSGKQSCISTNNPSTLYLFC